MKVGFIKNTYKYGLKEQNINHKSVTTDFDSKVIVHLS